MTNAIAKKENGNTYASFGNVVDNIFQNSLRRFFDDNFWDAEGQLSTASVPVNIRETEQQYELDVIAPGCRKEDFKISVDDNLLIISMNHTEEQKQENQKVGWVRNEYMVRSFSRSFTLEDTWTSIKFRQRIRTESFGSPSENQRRPKRFQGISR
jgi:HSP20 family protein